MKSVQAYFRNENEAEDVKASLQKLSVRDVRVEKVPESNTNLWDLIRDTFSRSNAYDEDHHNPHVLEFQVEEGQYAQAEAIVKENNGHIQ
ncbi:hypothetical protein FZC79_13950 [Rossellomorea vietnamensis]|uniref:Uncharacterized protein n=2 Tax=Rossellomorea TaxID=2837508 RepID=A0A5D4KB08_9BACI|nr:MULTISPECIES: hypothetical protein [Rossellomorea]TYR74574.1 hypothetical protein FZC79_13950 [Rossellomorea vietnamensis]TYS75137.1 hypothetical protein FZC80_18350 [Rossellomorea aquimaris]